MFDNYKETKARLESAKEVLKQAEENVEKIQQLLQKQCPHESKYIVEHAYSDENKDYDKRKHYVEYWCTYCGYRVTHCTDDGSKAPKEFKKLHDKFGNGFYKKLADGLKGKR